MKLLVRIRIVRVDVNGQYVEVGFVFTRKKSAKFYRVVVGSIIFE
jgi:hypothetical protein